MMTAAAASDDFLLTDVDLNNRWLTRAAAATAGSRYREVGRGNCNWLEGSMQQRLKDIPSDEELDCPPA
jgi:hypothetical protein